MPSAPLKPCGQIGCRKLVERGQGRCPEHARQLKAEYARYYTDDRGRSLYGSRWRRARRLFLLKHVFCVDCDGEGIATAATDVDHDPPHRGDERAFWNQRTWFPRCHRCHAKKTAREVAFGHVK